MSDTAVQPANAVDQWLASFDEALTAGDPAAAAELFLEDSYWRDLVAFTWNLKTVEGRDGVEDMLEETLASTKPSDWRTTEPPTEEEGVTTAWIEFETAAGRGNGLLRLRDGKAWTLLTALNELKGHEEPKGPGRSQGVEHHAAKGRETWLEARRREAEELGSTTQPEVVIVGGGQGGIALGARLRQLGVPTIIVERNAAPRRLVAQALQVAVPARPGLVRPPAVHQVPRELAGVLAQGQDRRLARDVHAGDGAQLLELDGGQEREVRRGRRRVAGRRRARRRRHHAAARSSSCSPPACRASPTCPRSPAWTSSRATSTTPPSTPARTPTRASAASSSAPTTPPTTSARRCGRRAPT